MSQHKKKRTSFASRHARTLKGGALVGGLALALWHHQHQKAVHKANIAVRNNEISRVRQQLTDALKKGESNANNRGRRLANAQTRLILMQQERSAQLNERDRATQAAYLAILEAQQEAAKRDDLVKRLQELLEYEKEKGTKMTVRYHNKLVALEKALAAAHQQALAVTRPPAPQV